jgi:hypothetical protein
VRILAQIQTLAVIQMKTLIIISFLSFWTTLLPAQKVRLEGDNSKYLCLNDSIAEAFEVLLNNEDVDSTISILYDFDNGRLPNSKSIIIWTHKGEGNIRLVEGCDKIMKDTTFSFNSTHLWQFISTTHFDDVSVPIKSERYRSHDKFYHITVIVPGRTFFVVVRDYERDIDKNKIGQSDTRVILANKIDSLLK